MKQTKGFTIIEVMIVLAIAGLILLIVFLAVPALQRNSRNTQRKNDVSAIIAGVNEWTTNNNGQLPSAAPTWVAPSITWHAGTTSQSKLGFFSGGIGGGPGQVTLNRTPTFPVAALAANAADDRVVVIEGGACAAGGAVNQGSARGVAVQYEIETGGGNFGATCQDS